MKRIFFHRKSILRAIHAACLTLFLAATTAARAQTATGNNGNVTISGSGTQYVYNGTNPTLSPTGTLVISSGSIISNTSLHPAIISIGQGAAVTNNGTLSVVYSGAPNTVTPISYTTASGQAVTITNSASLSGITPDITSTGAGLYFKNSGAGAVTVANSGSAYGSGHLGYGLYTSTMNGAITITNSAYVHVNAGTTGSGIYSNLQSQSIASPVAVSNSGYVKVTGSSAYGIEAEDSSTGSVTLTNSAGGVVSTASSGGSGGGLYVNANTGVGTVTNHGTVISTDTSSGTTLYGLKLYGDNFVATNTGTLSAQNTGASSSGVYSVAYAISGHGEGDITLTNSAAGTLTASATGDAAGVNVITYGNLSATRGTVMVTNHGNISATSSGYVGYGINATSYLGSVSVANSGLVSGTGSHSAYGVFAQNESSQYGTGNISVANTGEIDAHSTGSGYTAYGVQAGAEGNFTLTNTHGGTNSFSNSDATGLISATADNGSASGVVAGAGGALTLTNSGTIQATVTNTGQATGVQAIAGNGLTFTNNAGFAITASGAYGSGQGANVSSSSGNMVVTNNGTISAEGVTNPGLMSGTFTTLTANASGSGYMTVVNNGSLIASSPYGAANGISAGSGTDGPTQITNNAAGVITVTGGGASYGIHSSTSNGATLTNSGSISVTGSGAYGIVAFDMNSGNSVINNAGATITVSATNSGQSAIGVSSSSYGGPASTTNAGTISATSTGSTASGVYTAGNGSSVVINSGTISGSDYGGNANGVVVRQTFEDDATVTNSGSIRGTITGTTSSGSAYGVSVSVAENVTVTNSSKGSIQATSAGTGNAEGVQAVSYDSTIIVANAGKIVAQSGGYAAGINTLSHYGNGTTISNSGRIATTSMSAYGVTANDPSNLSVTNSTAGEITSTGGAGVGYGIVGQSNQVAVTNHGSVITSSAGTVTTGILEDIGNSATITNTGSVSASNTVGEAQGLVENGNGTGTVITSGSVSGVSTGTGDAYGVNVAVNGDVSIGSTAGTINASTVSGNSSGIFASSQGDVAVTNGGEVQAQSSTGSAIGLEATAPNGSITLLNTRTIVASNNSTTAAAYGIDVSMAGGNVDITNSGTVSGTNDGGLGYGIYVDPTGPIVVNNSGTAKGTTTGIYLLNAGTVNNSGLASGGVYSVYVPTGSTVNLIGASPVEGLIKGGSDDTSTSILNFDLAIRGNVGAAEAALAAAIAQYDAALAAAPKGPGNDVDSETVVINGVAYKWEDFAGITAALVQARLYQPTPGYQGIGAAIDNFNPGSRRGAAILAALDNLSDAAVPGALAQLSPQSLQVLRHIAFDNAGFTAANINNHLANLRDGLTGFDTSGFTVNAPGVDPTLTQIRSRLLAFDPAPFEHGMLSDSSSPLLGGIDMKDTKALVNTQPVDRWSTFISGSVILANVDNTTSNIGGADYTTGSVLAGVDYRLTDHFTVGALFDYAHTSADLDGNGSKATVDSYSPGVYASYVDKGWYGNGLLMYGFNSNTENRQITIPGIEGSNRGAADGGQVTTNLTGGYEFQRGPFKFGPIASLQYVHLTVGSFQEDGPTSLSINRQEADSLRTQVGFEARYSARSQTPLGLMTFTPHFQASWQHEYMDNSDGITSQFNAGAGGGSFVVQGQQPERDAAFLDLGLDAQVAKNVTIFIDYQTQAGQDNFFAQSAQGGVRIGF